MDKQQQMHFLTMMLSRANAGYSEVVTGDGRWDRGTKEDAEPLVKAGLIEYQENGSVGYTLTLAGVRAVVENDPEVFGRYNTEDMIRDVLDRAVFHPFPEGHKNAGGKSFFRRMLGFTVHRGKKPEFGTKAIPKGSFPVREFIHLSMEGRTTAYMASMVYGTEEWCSTGENSSRTVTKGMQTADSRLHTSVLYWDEPDIGMSAGVAAGAGQAIAKWLPNASPLVNAVFI